MRVLNRVIRCTASAWESEADQRHADILVKGLDMEKANPVTSAGEDEKPHDVEENLAELSQRD